MFDMINIFEVFLPQLLRYPNPTDPLNGEAAALLMREPKSYDAKVKGKLSSLETVKKPCFECLLQDPQNTLPSMQAEKLPMKPEMTVNQKMK